MSEDQTPEAEQPSTRIRVDRGGDPSHEQLAALVVALSPGPGETGDQPRRRTPPWRYAAIHEAIGHRPFLSADDLQGGRFPLT